MPTKATPLRNATTAGGWIAPFRLSTESRSELSALGWTEDMLTELDKRVERARFDTGIPMPTDAQVAAALESVRRAAAGLHAELKALDWRTGHILDDRIARHLSDLETGPRRLRERLTNEAMAISVLIHSMLRNFKPRRSGPPLKRLNNAVAVIVREIMAKHGQQPMVEGGAVAIATEATLRELGVLASVTARHSLRRAAKTTR